MERRAILLRFQAMAGGKGAKRSLMKEKVSPWKGEQKIWRNIMYYIYNTYGLTNTRISEKSNKIKKGSKQKQKKN